MYLKLFFYVPFAQEQSLFDYNAFTVFDNISFYACVNFFNICCTCVNFLQNPMYLPFQRPPQNSILFVATISPSHPPPHPIILVARGQLLL